MPWARSFCPFRACGANLQNLSKESITTDKYKLKTFIIKAIKHFFANFAAKK